MFRHFRFGFLSLFAAMLLMVSAAGWWSFRRDLYVEEIEALETLRRAGLKLSVRRAEGGWAEPPEDEEKIPWSAPLVAPLATIHIDGKPTAQERNVALRLPRLEAYSEGLTHEQDRQDRDRFRTNLPDAFDLDSLLETELPAIGESVLDEARLDEPLPHGEAVSDEQTRRIADEIRTAWRNPAATPGRRLVHSHKTFFEHDLMGFDGERTVYVDDGARGLWYWGYDNTIYPESLVVCHSVNQVGYFRRGEAWRRTSRWARQSVGDFEEQARHFPRDDFPYHGLNLHGWRLVGRTFDAMPEIALERVERIDDVRYRVDFAPLAANREKPEERKAYDADPQVLTWQTVLRSDLAWAPEETLIVERIETTDFERRLVQRFERVEGHVVLAERLLNDRVVNGQLQERSRTIYATDVNPDIADAAFDPATLDLEAWPEPRPLPVWRWYRVTFVLSLALFAFLIARSLASIFRRRTVPSDPQHDSASDVVEPAQT